mgnify:CR=1 FL=1
MREALFIDTKKGKIFSMIHRPDSTVKCPIVLFFHGFTGSHIEAHFMFARMSKILEKEGIGSVRFDFRGSGNSDLDFSEMTIFTELEDAETVLDYVKRLDWVDERRIGIVGLSMGGVVAALLAERRGKEIKSICLWAPALKNKEVFQTKAEEKGVNESFETWDVGGLSIGKAFLDSILSFDAWDKLKNFQGKVMIIHGTGDETVPFSHSEEISRKLGFELVRIEGADHVFSSEKWLRVLFEETLNFFKRTLRG